MSLNQKHLDSDARAHKAYAAAKPVNAAPSRTILNSSSTGQYKPPVWPVRAGADDHTAIGSRGYV